MTRESETDNMKYTIEQLKSAIQTIKETCQEHFDDCDNCPLCMTEEGGDCYCATDFEKRGESMIEFISYSGKYPTLCMGKLKFRVNGKLYTTSNLLSGGSVGFTEDGDAYIEKGPWELPKGCLPKELVPYEKEIIEMINENVEHGCCGGCL